jgi:hypothetical protein
MARGGQQRAQCAKGGWRVSFQWSALLLLLLSTRVSLAQWDFTHAGDPARNWGVVATESVGYDDNFNATEKDRESGVRLNSDLKLRANIPLERFFAGMQYDYGVTYPQSVKLGGINQTHNLNLAANYTASPRLALNASETFINSLQPELVSGPAGPAQTIFQAGTYIYDAVGGGLTYSLAPRWSLAASGSWDIWDYQESSIASNENHQDYSATLSALYLLDTRTTVGLNYQYTQNVFINPGINNGLDGSSQTLYLSLVRRFNPRLSLTLNGGYTIRESEDGSQSTSPSALGTLVYNYGPVSTITLTLAQALSEATVGVTREFSAQQNTSLDLQISHRITARLRAIGEITYVFSSFVSPLGNTTVTRVPVGGFLNPTFTGPQGITVSPSDQALTAHLNLSYAFRDWVSAVMDYYYTESVSSDTALIPAYTRNQISAGISLSY